MKRKNSTHYQEKGVVSLFVVVFAALLMTVVTISFVQLMLKDQQAATTSDLSQSAYDSAQAGVEDAKRLLLLNQACQNGTAPSAINCATIAAALAPPPGQTTSACNALAKAGLVGETNNETIVQQSVNDNAAKLDQAYTCVKIAVNTDDFKDALAVNQSSMVALRGVSDFDTVEISWFGSADVPSTSGPNVGFPTTGPNVSLPPIGNSWRVNYPSLLRAQFIQTGANFALSDFDNSQPGNKSDVNTLFLYPSATGVGNFSFALDARRSPSNAPQQVSCSSSFAVAEYVCTATIALPIPIDGSTANRNAFLNLSALYNSSSYRVRLKKGATYVQFAGVQPIVDSTGRANIMFRRVQSRIQLGDSFTYPTSELDLQGDLCKNFTITDTDSGYINSSTCNP